MTGEALGKADEVDKLIAGIDDQFATVREEHPDWQGKSVAVVDPFQPGKYAVFHEDGPEGGLHDRDGLRGAGGDQRGGRARTTRPRSPPSAPT